MVQQRLDGVDKDGQVGAICLLSVGRCVSKGGDVNRKHVQSSVLSYKAKKIHKILGKIWVKTWIWIKIIIEVSNFCENSFLNLH